MSGKTVKDVTGDTLSYSDLLTPKSLTTYFIDSQQTTTRQQLGSAFKATFTPYNILYIGGGAMDYISSFTCSGVIYSTGWSNYSNNNNQIPLDTFDQMEATGAGWVLFSLAMIAFPLSLLREVYRNYRKKNLDSLKYHERCLKKLGYKKRGMGYRKNLKNDVESTYYRLLSQKKVVNNLARTRVFENAAYVQKSFQPNKLARFAALFTGKFALSERNILFDFLGSDYDAREPDIKRAWVEKCIIAASLVVRKLWDYINDNAFIYWLVWFAFAAIIGFAAASSSVIFTPIIIGVTLCLGAVYYLPKIINWMLDFTKTNDDIREKRLGSKHHQELTRMKSELKYRHFMIVEHDLNEAYLISLGVKKPQKTKHFWDRNKPQKVLHRKKEKVQKSKLAKYLMRRSNMRIVLAVATDVVNTIMLVSFSVWLISASVFAFAGFIPVFASYDGYIGIVLGVLFGLRKILDMKAEKRENKRYFHEKLCEEYRDTGQTKLEVFEIMENRVKYGEAYAEWQRLKILLKVSDVQHPYASTLAARFESDKQAFSGHASTETYQNYFKKLSAEQAALAKQLKRADKCPSDDVLAAEYDLKKIDVYNHDYREKQRYQAGWSTIIKYLANRVYTFFGGGQVGSMLAKSFFISACLLGGISASATGTLPLFLGLALVLSVIYAVVCLVQYIIERDRQHRMHFVNNMDGNISYLKKKVKELNLLNRHLANQRGGKDEKTDDVRANGQTKKMEPVVKYEKLVKKKKSTTVVNQFTLLGSGVKHKVIEKTSVVKRVRMTV